MIKLALAVLVILSIFFILRKLLASGPDKDMAEELKRVQLEAERLELEEEIARKQSKNRAKQEKIDSLSENDDSDDDFSEEQDEDIPEYTF